MTIRAWLERRRRIRWEREVLELLEQIAPGISDVVQRSPFPSGSPVHFEALSAILRGLFEAASTGEPAGNVIRRHLDGLAEWWEEQCCA